MTRTLFPGSEPFQHLDAGFSLAGTLFVLLALSFIAVTVISAVNVRHRFVMRETGQFYAELSAETDRWEGILRREGFPGEVNESD